MEVKFDLRIKISYPTESNSNAIDEKIIKELSKRIEFIEDKKNTNRKTKTHSFMLIKEDVKPNEVEGILREIQDQANIIKRRFYEDWEVGKKLKVKFKRHFHESWGNIEIGKLYWFAEEELVKYSKDEYEIVGKLTKEEFDNSRGREVAVYCCEEGVKRIYWYEGFEKANKMGKKEVVCPQGWAICEGEPESSRVTYDIKKCPLCGAKLP